jgi:hypothetical protein
MDSGHFKATCLTAKADREKPVSDIMSEKSAARKMGHDVRQRQVDILMWFCSRGCPEYGSLTRRLLFPRDSGIITETERQEPDNG